ncbi:MAG: hypothetical protein ACLUYV_06175 [Alistipes shahii]
MRRNTPATNPDQTPSSPKPLAAKLGTAGFLVPPSLPLTLCLTVSYAFRGRTQTSTATSMITIGAPGSADGEQTPLDGVTMLSRPMPSTGIAGVSGRSVRLRAVYGLLTPRIRPHLRQADAPCGG